jgi:hypothetical protein
MNVSVEEITEVNVKEIQEALLELKQADFKEYKAKLPFMGRCAICTLRPPCKHFSHASQLPRTQAQSERIKHMSTGFNVHDYLPKLSPDTHNRGFGVRYRGRSTVYNFDFDGRNTVLPNEKRLKQLEEIESYREEKLKKEIEKIQGLKAEEKKTKQDEEAAEELRKRYMEKQKRRLREYQEGFGARKEMIKELLGAEEESKKREEEKRKKYMEMQKIKLDEYHEKKRLLSKISKQKVMDLEDEVTNHKPIKVRRYTADKKREIAS